MTDAGVEHERRIIIRFTEEDMARQDLPFETLRVGGTLAGVFHIISWWRIEHLFLTRLLVTNYVLPVVPAGEAAKEYTLKEALTLYWNQCQKEAP